MMDKSKEKKKEAKKWGRTARNFKWPLVKG